MSVKAIIAALVVVLAGVAAFLLFFTTGEGRMVYVKGEAATHREKGEFLLNKRRHTTDRPKRAELLTQAIDEFNLALEKKPDFEVAYNMLGHCYIERGQWEDALKNLNKALELREDYPAALFNRARVYQQLSIGRRDHDYIDRAIQDYQKALESELAAGFIGDIRKALSEAYRQKGDLGNAIAQLEAYLKRSPHAEDSELVRRKIRGLSLMHKGNAPPP
jgi:tetratricopeptide (TPR) repeat protein